jgi:hypothetical protein
MTTDRPGEPTQTNEITTLRAEIADLRILLNDMSQRTTLANVLDNGLSALNDKLAPLSSLLNRGGKLSDAESKTLRAIRLSLASPDYTELEAPLVGVDDGKPPYTTGGKAS